MSFLIFGGNDQQIEFLELSSRTRQMKLGYLHYLRGPHLLACNSHYSSDRPCETWESYIKSFQHWTDTEIEENEYVGHLMGKGEAIVKFRSMDFIRGVIRISQWFDLAWESCMGHFYYHQKPTTLQEIMMTTSTFTLTETLTSTLTTSKRSLPPDTVTETHTFTSLTTPHLHQT